MRLWTLLVTLSAGVSSANAQSNFPTATGNRWTYLSESMGDKPSTVTWELGETKEITYVGLDGREKVKGKAVELKAVRMRGNDFRHQYLVEIEDGIRIIGKRQLCKCPDLEIFAELRWGKDDKWEFRGEHSKDDETVKCSRTELKSVTVPAGTFDCATFTIAEVTYKVARGVGIVVLGHGDTVYKLASYEIKVGK